MTFFLLFFFFFSSRRRHTRYIGDWSSDVCSSDLGSWLRQRKREGAAPAGRALHPERSAVQLHEPLREREPETGPLSRSFGIAADLAELLEDPLLILRGYPDAGVANGHGGRAVLACRADVHAAAVRG